MFGDPDFLLRQVKRVEFFSQQCPEDTLSLVFRATLSENACTMRQRWDLEAYDVVLEDGKNYIGERCIECVRKLRST